MARSKTLKLLIPLLLAFFAGSASADVLDEILESGTIRVAVAKFAPWTMKTASGDLIGFEIELAKTLADLNDAAIVVAAVTGTASYSVADIFFDRANVKAYATPALAETEVLEGRAHVYLAGMPAARYLAFRASDKIDVPLDKPLLAHSEAIAIRKGEQSLMNFLNAG